MQITVPAHLDGARLDRALAALFPEHTRAWAQAQVRAGRVKVDGQTVAKSSAAVRSGAALELSPGAPSEGSGDLQPRAAAPAIEIVHADEHLIVVNKPAGLLTHRAGARRESSVAEQAESRFGRLPSLQGADRPGIAHRLDVDTSGLLALGRSEPALAGLVRAFRERRVAKRYEAIVQGEPRFDSLWIESPIARSERHPERMEIAAPGEGRPAETFYSVRRRFRGFAHLDCRPTTGRTHQIRVHLASIGHALVGERTYRAPGGRKSALPDSAPALARHALHAAELAFEHPITGEALVFSCALPPDLAELLAWLGAER